MQKLSSKTQTRLKFRTTILFLFGGTGVFFILVMLAFVFYNLGRTENSLAAGSIGTIKSGNWTDDMVWNLHRKPGNNEEIIIGQEALVTINSNVQLENVTIKIYGTLTLSSGKLRLDDNSTILIAKSGQINTIEGSNSLISFGTEGESWIGNQINAIGSPSQLTYSGESSIDLLPVQLSFFGGTITPNNEVLLEWQTLSEKNNSFFTIEKRIDNESFTSIDTVIGAGNSNVTLRYQYIDETLSAESVFYRLKQTDFDGNSEYFNIINVTNENPTKFVQVPSIQISQAGPNPFNDTFTISYTATENDKVEVNIRSIEGKVVHRELLDSSQGENHFTFNNKNQIASGMYIVTLTNSGKSDFIKLIKM